MSKRAEEAALKAYPVEMIYGESTLDGKYDGNKTSRYYFIKGYEQAEKDLVSLIQSRLKEILGDAQPNPILRVELQELIKKIKEEYNG